MNTEEREEILTTLRCEMIKYLIAWHADIVEDNSISEDMELSKFSSWCFITSISISGKDIIIPSWLKEMRSVLLESPETDEDSVDALFHELDAEIDLIWEEITGPVIARIDDQEDLRSVRRWDTAAKLFREGSHEAWNVEIKKQLAETKICWTKQGVVLQN